MDKTQRCIIANLDF